MPRVPLTTEQRVEYKLTDFKRWVREQMARNGMTQTDVGKAIGFSQGQISQMLKIPKEKKKGGSVERDPFTLGQVLVLFDLFEADDDTRKKLIETINQPNIPCSARGAWTQIKLPFCMCATPQLCTTRRARDKATGG